MDTSRIIRGIVNSRGYTITSAITQWDYGYVLDDHMRTRKAICFNYSTGQKVGEVM